MIHNRRGIFGGVGVIIVAVVVTTTVLALVLNQRCLSSFANNRLVYPSAELVGQVSTFLGLQRAVYHTPDTSSAVEAWYQGQRNVELRNAVTSGDFSLVSAANWMIAPADEGTTITFETTCP